MNKLFTKIVGAVLGLTMAIGVGVAVASSAKEASGVYADSTTISMSERASTLGWSNSVAYTSWESADGIFTVTASGGGNNGKWYTSSGGSWRMYSGGTVTISCSSTYTITNVSSSPTCSWTVNAQSASFSPSARTDFTSITITYSTGGGTTTYSLTYNANKPVGASGSVSGMPSTNPVTGITSGTNYTLETTLPTLDGYTCLGWGLTADATSTINQITVDANKNVYAIWEEQSGSSVTASTTISDYASAHSWANGTQYTSLNLDSNIAVTANGGGNTGKYYSSGNDWRFYQNESASVTIAAANSITINSITITYTVSNTGVLKDGNSNVNSGSSVTVNANSKTFSVGNTGSATNGQVRITEITVIYSSGGSSLEDLQITYTSLSEVTLFVGGLTSTISGLNVSGCDFGSSDETVATVSNQGVISPVGTGNATITISHDDDSQYHYISASVLVKVSKVYDYSTDFTVVSLETAYASTPATGDSEKMMVVGHIVSMDTQNPQYGNGYLENTNSPDKTLRIYGMYDIDGNRGTSMTNPTVPVKDDVVVLQGVFCFYNSTWEIKDAVVRQKNGTTFKVPSSISVQTAPTDCDYNAGEYFDPTGLVITVNYDDETSENISYLGHESAFTFTPSLSTALATNNNSVTIEYQGITTTQSITVNAVPAVISVTVSPSSGSVNIGSTTTLTATVAVEGGAAQTVSWSSSSDSIATVANGVVTGVSAGTATITATSTVDGTKSGSATIEVVDPSDTKIGTYTLVKDASLLNAGDWIVITNIAGTFGMGEQGSNKFRSQVAVTLTGSDIVIGASSNPGLKAAKLSVKNSHFEMKTDEGYLYASSSSSNDVGSRATNDDANGEWVFSINSSTGDADCTAQGTNSRNILRYNSNNTRFSCYASSTTTMAQIHIYKKLPATAAVSLSSNKEVLTSVGDTATLTAKAYSDSGKTKEISGLTNADFEFESGNTNVLTVDANGVITAAATGETTITVSRNECEASVTIKVVYVTIDLINSGTSIEAGSEGTFTFSWSSDSLKPTSYEAEWSSSNDDAFVVETDGSYLAGDAGESATITVTVIDDDLNEYVATRTFSTVSTIVDATHISVTESSGVTAYVGTNVNLHITVLGDGDVPATNQNVVCTSSNADVLTVTNGGVITPKARGIATVTIVDEGHLCDPVEVSVRVRNVVLGDAKIMGVLTAPESPTTASDILEHFETQNNFDAPNAVTQTGGYGDRTNYFRIAAGSSAGSISVNYDELLISKIVVVGKRYSANKADPTVEGATASSAFTAEDTTVTFTFEDPVNEFTLNASSGNQFCCKSITVYSTKEDKSSSADAQALYSFEELNMHLDDYNSNLGYCKDSEHHYYSTAKNAFNSLTKDQRDTYTTNAAFVEGWARLSAWAAANGESLNSSSQLAAGRILPIAGLTGENINTIAIIVVISMISLTAIGGYFYLRKRKENN